ncbi:MAG: hypothetical protein FWC12_12720 [Treponema sp.]|nr:hypothetical protein [Treponema sp.]
MKYESDIMKAMHQEAVAMYKIGGITEERMQEYDELCLKNPKIKKQSSPVNNDKNSVKLKIAGHATA